MILLVLHVGFLMNFCYMIGFIITFKNLGLMNLDSWFWAHFKILNWLGSSYFYNSGVKFISDWKVTLLKSVAQSMDDFIKIGQVMLYLYKEDNFVNLVSLEISWILYVLVNGAV